jgi:Zn-dependent protease with chaperone function/Zn-finger nucleic acid-binding protein
MHCPRCQNATLRHQPTKQGTLVKVCPDCHGLWLDDGEIYEFSPHSQQLEQELQQGLHDRRASNTSCPRCRVPMERGSILSADTQVDGCPSCKGLWFDAQSIDHVVNCPTSAIHMDWIDPEPVPESDPTARAAAHDRLRDVAAGLLALPNLAFRSALTLTFLYGILALVLIVLVQAGVMEPGFALVLGVAIAGVQFALGPWIMDCSLDWFFTFRWVTQGQLPEHLRQFVTRVTAEHKMPFPTFGIIDDGAPTAFTYGHHPGNARVILSRGILELLEPAEVEAVVAHELGHAVHWDMALMTLANLVPLLLYYLYRLAADLRFGREDDDENNYSWLVSIGAYVLYIVSQYMVLWFSRTREYYADRFAGQVTGDPNALASALVKIAYGLASQSPARGKGETSEEKHHKGAMLGTVGALNIFERSAAVGLVMASASGSETQPGKLDVEQVKSAMQWDLWNPWAKYHELHSTHPLVAKRLQYLTDQAAHVGQEPLVVFDRRKPESYWDDFAVDALIMLLPWLAFFLGLGGCLAIGMLLGIWKWAWISLTAGVGLAGVASLAKTNFAYRRDFFPHLSVAALLHKVKVSEVRPVPATLTGTLIGRGVPGLVYSEDFVLRDRTGIIFLNYRQPLAIWNFLFGLFGAGAYQGKEVRVTGWYRRAPVPFMEVNRLEVLDRSLASRQCYSYHARSAVGFILTLVGFWIAGMILMS